MKRIVSLFARLKREKRCGVIAYVTCGDPDVESTVRIVRELEKSGADCIELGVPFSDPIADGPVIQAASNRALARGTTIDDVLTIARRIRVESRIPLVVFSYLNPILRVGLSRFAADAADAGVDAVLVVDLPPESARGLREALRKRKLGMIFLLAPTSTPERIALVNRTSSGFVYYVSTTGVTGARRELDTSLLGRLDEVRTSLRKPIAVGFGISRPEHIVALDGHCDAVVIGSAIVAAIGDGPAEDAPQRAGEMLRSIVGQVPDARV